MCIWIPTLYPPPLIATFGSRPPAGEPRGGPGPDDQWHGAEAGGLRLQVQQEHAAGEREDQLHHHR